MIGGASIPAFLLALLSVLFLNGDLHLLPASGDTGVTNPPTGPTGMIIPDSLVPPASSPRPGMGWTI